MSEIQLTLESEPDLIFRLLMKASRGSKDLEDRLAYIEAKLEQLPSPQLTIEQNIAELAKISKECQEIRIEASAKKLQMYYDLGVYLLTPGHKKIDVPSEEARLAKLLGKSKYFNARELAKLYIENYEDKEISRLLRDCTIRRV